MITLGYESPQDARARSTLLDQAFGADRFEKASYRLRRDVAPVHELSRVARKGDDLVATVRLYPITVMDMLSGSGQEALLLGPLAVHPDLQGQGVARKLMWDTLKRADVGGYRRIFLVGDAKLYGQYGFRSVRPCYLTLPGGRDADRLMVRDNGLMPALPSVGQLVSWAETADTDDVGLQHAASATPLGEPLYRSA